MKKFLSILSVWILIITNIWIVWANNLAQKEVNRSQAFQFIGDYIVTDMPKSYQYIQLNFTDVRAGSKLYDSLQKMVFLDVIENNKWSFGWSKPVSTLAFYRLLETITGFDFLLDGASSLQTGKLLTYQDLADVVRMVEEIQSLEIDYTNQNTWTIWDQYNEKEYDTFQIYFDVYDTLKYQMYGNQNLDSQELIYGSIKWLTQGTNDEYTTFFPPVDAADFNASMSWEFEWIWAYVDMPSPGVLQIISPISGFPAEKAGIKAWDIILKAWEVEITSKMSLEQAVSHVKWPAGSKVVLTIQRGEEILEIEVTREKIILNDVEYEILENGIFYIQIRQFGDKVNAQFVEALENLKKSQNIKKVVIDLRNNPGWYLEQVNDMLSAFIEKWAPVAVVKYNEGSFAYESKWYDILDLSQYDVYLLGNGGTASASEIMIGTMKDYFSNVTFVWEKTFWKWSVQTLKTYFDGSALKFTIAKWYTGKTQTGIDGIGISPDVEILISEEDEEKWIDTQLEWVKRK